MCELIPPHSLSKFIQSSPPCFILQPSRAVLGIRKLWDMANCSEPWAEGSLPVPAVPGAGSGEAEFVPCCHRGWGTGTPQHLLRGLGSITHLQTGCPGHSTPATSAQPLSLPPKHLFCLVLVAQNPHSEAKKAFHPHSAVPLQSTLFMAIIHA